MDLSNLKGLSNQAMVGATRGWVDPEKERPVLMGIPEVAGYVDRMTAAHQGIIDCQLSQQKSELDEQLEALSERAAGLDRTHDNLIRGISLVLEGNALLADDEPLADQLDELRKRLLPEGLSAVNRTYLEEAGEVEMTKGRLDTGDHALLGRVPAVSGDLKGAVDRWFAAGTELGDVERERTQLAEAENKNKGVTRSDVVKARNQWIRVVRAVLAGLDLAEGLEEETLTTLLQPLKNAVDKLKKKGADEGEATAEAPA